MSLPLVLGGGDEEVATKGKDGEVSSARPVSVANQTQCCGKLKERAYTGFF